jgi:superfamily II DNA helicase RecQ
LPGVTLVVTTLLALMKDQVESLHEHGIPAAMISSAQADGEVAAALEDVRRASPAGAATTISPRRGQRPPPRAASQRRRSPPRPTGRSP